MEALTISLDLKAFQILLNGLSQIVYRTGAANISYDYLVERIYSNTELESSEIRNEIQLFETVYDVHLSNFIYISF